MLFGSYAISGVLYALVYWLAGRAKRKTTKAHIRMLAAVFFFTPFIFSFGHFAVIGPIWCMIAFVIVDAAVEQNLQFVKEIWLNLLGMGALWLVLAAACLIFYSMPLRDEDEV